VTNNTKTPEEKTYRFWGMTLKAKLRIKCKNCGNWSIIEVKKIFVNSGTSDSKLKIFLPAYLPLKTENCSTCSQVIAKENGIIRARRRS
jgi:ribosomal protein S27E